MGKLIIENVGPIKKVEFDLNKINVFMGPQSSGKSTIAKIISFCSWLDKRFSKEGLSNKEPKSDYIQELKRYHRLTNGYFNGDSKIYFLGEFIELNYNNCQPMLLTDNVFGFDHWASDKKKYRCEIGTRDSLPTNNSKVVYIPAERNFVSAIYNLQEYLRDRDNIQDFVNAWYEVKRKYSLNNKLNILDLGAEYYSEGEVSDRLYLKQGGDIPLQIASSGLQAVVPLITMFDYVTKGLYKEMRPMSPKDHEELKGKINELLEERGKDRNLDNSLLLDITNIFRLRSYHYSQIIIEEPEQNLFPSTQRDLIYYFLNILNSVNQDHRLTFTTHSPYILYALNNCMMGYLVNHQLQGDEQTDYLKNNFPSANSWINPESVSVWEIENGKIRTIQDKDHIISENYFDLKMTELVDEYYLMLNYYKDEE